jgi:transcriptional regulator with XRE-family HTH domain
MEKEKKKRIYNVNFAEICIEVRQITGMTEKQMAAHLNTSLGNYRKYENGKIKPGPEAAFRLAGMYLAFCRIENEK